MAEGRDDTRPLGLELARPGLDFAQLRSAGKDALSLALIDARNHTLRWAALLEAAPGGPLALLPADLPPSVQAELDPPLWTLGRLAWFQEYWIARNVQRSRASLRSCRRPIWPSMPKRCRARVERSRCRRC